MTVDPTPTTDADDVNRVWQLMEQIRICMLASLDGEKIRARPMAAHPRQAGNVVYFLTDERGHKDEEVDRDENVCLIFAKPGDGKYLTVTGVGRVRNNRDLVHQLWSTPAEAWWDSPDDPGIRVLEVTPEDAQFWEGPHGVAATIAMVVAAATAQPPVMGDQRKVDLH